MRVIVLGGSGQIGSVVREHLSGNHDVISTSRKGAGQHIQFDPFRNNWAVLGEADVLVNCIGAIHASGIVSFDRVHMELTRCIINNRATIGNPRIVQISTLGASPQHRSDFLRTKGIADNLLLQEPDTAVIRPSIVCTHSTMLVKKMLMLSRVATYTMGTLLLPAGFLSNRIQPVMPNDLAGIVEALCRPYYHRIVDVVGAEMLTFGDILAILSTIRGQQFRAVKVSRKVMDAFVRSVVSRLFPRVITTDQYGLLFEDNVADNKRCTELLGTPMTPVIPFFKSEFSDGTN